MSFRDTLQQECHFNCFNAKMRNFVFVFRRYQFNIVQIIGTLQYLEHYPYIPIKKTFHIWSYSEWICLKLLVLKCVISHKTYICNIYISFFLNCYKNICIHTNKQTNKQLYTHTYIHTCMHTYIHTYMHAYIHTYIHIYIHTYVHNTYMHACVYAHIYVRTYIHTNK
jgi:hypothetical protein